MTSQRKKAPRKRGPKAASDLDIPPHFSPVVAAFARRRGVTVEKGWAADNVVLKMRGKIFAMLVRGELVAKLPKQRVDALVDRSTGRRFDPGHGRLMKEWIVVGHGAAPWVELAEEAFRFVKG